MFDGLLCLYSRGKLYLKEMSAVSGFIINSLLITLAYFLGMLTFLADYDDNKCEMTYMFEYPQFVRIFLDADLKFRKYGLYAYSEGQITERARNMYFDGMPVLFIPGNMGSYKQARSLASMALRKSHDSRPGFHLDFFTVDLNEELCGFNGAHLHEQTQYVNHSIYRILELYEGRRYKPKSVIIIGHSMGGVISRGVLQSLPINSTLIPIIISLATPHIRSPFSLDKYTAAYYNNLAESLNPNVTFISLSGGYSDFLIPTHLTKLKDSRQIHSVTTSVPLVWLSSDHLCILWCKQLVSVLTRALFDVVDSKTKQVSTDSAFRHAVFNHYLLHNSGTKIQLADRYALPFQIGTDKDEWIENIKRQYSTRLLNGTKHTQWHMIRLTKDHAMHEMLTVAALNLEVTDWIFACPAIHVKEHSRVCLDAIHLSHISEIAPTVRYKRRMININLHKLKNEHKNLTHVVIKVVPTNDPVILHVDVYNSNDRKLTANLPNWFSVNPHTLISETAEGAITYEILFPQLINMGQSYRFYLTSIKCSGGSNHATITLSVPWGNEKIQHFVTESKMDPFKLRLYSSKPAHSNLTASIKLTLDPTCRYSVSVKHSILGTLAQLARLYTPLLIANITAVVLLSLKSQLNHIGSRDKCSIFFVALKEGVKPYYVLTFTKVASKILSYSKFCLFLPVPDWQILADEGIDFLFLPLLLYMCSVGIVYLSAFVVAICVILFESSVHKLVLKFLSPIIAGTVTWSDWLLTGLHKLPGVMAFLLVLLSFTTCGSLALCLGCIFYFVKLTHMSQEYIEGLLLQNFKKIRTSVRHLFFNTSQQNEGDDQSDEPASLGDVSDNISNRDVTEQENNEDSNVNENSDTPEEDAQSVNTEMANKYKKHLRDDNFVNNIHIHFSIFLIWCIVTSINIPYMLSWAHNYKYNTTLQPDPSFLPGFIFSLCAVPLWQLDIPKINRVWYKELGYIIYFITILMLIYAPVSVYRVNYALMGVITYFTIHQLIAPKEIDLCDDSSESENGDVFRRTKEKME